MQWMLYPFHDDDNVVMVLLIVFITNRGHLVRKEIYFVAANLLCHRRLVRMSPEDHQNNALLTLEFLLYLLIWHYFVSITAG